MFYRNHLKKENSEYLPIKSIIASYGSHFYDSKICKTSAYAFQNLCGCDVVTGKKRVVFGFISMPPDLTLMILCVIFV